MKTTLGNRLTDSIVKDTEPSHRPKRISDGRGMYLEISPAGGRLWRLKFRFAGKEKCMSLGTYPDVSLAKARQRREAARRLIADGVNPVERRRAEKALLIESAQNSFKEIALEWHRLFSPKWTNIHGVRILRALERDIFPWVGDRPIRAITSQELLVVLRRMEARGVRDSARRVLQCCGRVFRFAVASGRADRDPTRDLIGALAPAPHRHFASLTEPAALGELLRAIDGYRGAFVTRCALRLAPLLFVRPGELRQAEWVEFDFAKSEWRIPGRRMKMRSPHIVPLARQAIAILEELKAVTGRFPYAFPNVRSRFRPMSDGALICAIRRMGYTPEEMTAHGFRSVASTLLNEQGWNFDAIERQLAHGERNSVRAAYNHARYLPERCTMMQAWADHIDQLRASTSSRPAAEDVLTGKPDDREPPTTRSDRDEEPLFVSSISRVAPAARPL
jgi:integrase